VKRFAWCACLLLIALSIGVSACDGSSARINEIRDRGVLRVGVKVDVPDFGYLNPTTGEIEGMEIDLARLMAEELLGDGRALKLISVTAQTRGSMLDNGELDVVIATFTITEERKKSYYFSEPYFSDEIGLLVKADSGIAVFNDLDQKTVGSVQSGTARKALEAEEQARGIVLTYAEYASYPEIHAALMKGEIDAFAVDKSILQGYVDETTIILDEGFNPQSYGIAVRLDDKDMTKFLDEFMKKIEEDGRLEELQERWERQPKE